MVRVRMRIEHCIHMIDPFPHGLHPKIRAGVDDDSIRAPSDGDGGTGAPVAWVSGRAHPAPAAKSRHTHRGATAQNRDLCFHALLTNLLNRTIDSPKPD